MAEPVPLATLLSQILIAFTIECDNEFEQQMLDGSRVAQTAADTLDPTWLVSLVMWSNFMRFIGDEITVRNFLHDAELGGESTQYWLTRMQRPGGFIDVHSVAQGGRQGSPADWVIRPTAAGRRAQQIWKPLAGVIENRWQERFGNSIVAELTASLYALVVQLDVELPEYLPVVGYGFAARIPRRQSVVPMPRKDDGTFGLHLPALLSKVFFAFTLEFESESDLSLAISANVIRVIAGVYVRTGDVPGLSGVSKEAIATAMRFLAKHGYVGIESDRPSRQSGFVRLTPLGQAAQAHYRAMSARVEERWHTRFGSPVVRRLQAALAEIIRQGTGPNSLLALGLQPHPGGWRARKPYLAQTLAVIHNPAGALPHYPLILHRGGWPDGN